MTTQMTRSETAPARTTRDPFRILRDEFDSLISRFTPWEPDWLSTSFTPSVDLSESDASLQVRMDVPGVKPDDIDIEVTGRTLRVSGERKEEKEEKGKTFHRIERRSGSFQRVVTLPCDVKDSHVDAHYDQGVLTITLPKNEKDKTHKIKVKNGK